MANKQNDTFDKEFYIEKNLAKLGDKTINPLKIELQASDSKSLMALTDFGNLNSHIKSPYPD